MFLYVFFTILCVCLFVFLKYLINSKEEKLPKGLKRLRNVKGVPILGIFPQITSPLYNYLVKIGKIYGNIFTINLGMRKVIVMNDFQIIKKTIKNEGDNFAGRWQTKLKTIVSNDSGILFADGEHWFKQRAFILKVFRDFGFGKSRSNEIIQLECKFLIEELNETNGHSVDFSELIPIYTANVISKFLMNKRFSRTDPKIRFIEYAVFETSKKQNYTQLFHLLFPIFDDSELVSRFSLWITSRLSLFSKIENIFEKEVQEHLNILDFESEGEDFIDRFLIHKHNLLKNGKQLESFTDKQLIHASFEMFAAGYETTSTTLTWALLFMSRYPHIQKLVYNEIIENIGNTRTPTMNDKKSLNYTQAVIDEILRFSSVVPMGLFHRTFNSTSVDGYFIPKNSLIFTNLYACHTDSKVWEKPMEFYPDHFLYKTETDDMIYLPREELIPFSIGKRQCLGESLAKMEIFIFFVSILQRFEVRFAEEISDIQYQEALLGNEGMIRYSKIKNYTFIKH